MSRRGRSTPVDPGPRDVYTLLDGSQWIVTAAAGGVVQLEQMGTAIVRTVRVHVRDLLVAVNGWRRACPI
ncbi:hypothetical protein [Leucobacter sp. UCD-THU]|uniref:hypothetical protein n=1 Tax=Leucobacter sp. UCD-THU TaxID=1292023 RepID=UPI0012685868|nr:hypothetical protein [Leucobacter sp. UCD-THU]